MTRRELHVEVGGANREKLEEAIRLLNARGVHINTRGALKPLDGQTVIALAEVVRAFDRAKGAN